jgi:hypothetical protein
MLLAALVAAATLLVIEQAQSANGSRLKVFLDCSSDNCHDDYLREEVEIVEYVRDRNDSDVHVLITSAETGAKGLEYTLTFIGQGVHASTARTLKVTTAVSDTEDSIRRALESALTLGLLAYLAPDSLPAGLAVTATLDAQPSQPITVDDDPWNRWIVSLNGNGSIDSEESTREEEWGLSISADRITPMWKLTFGVEFEQSIEEFDLDEEEPLEVSTRSRDSSSLAVRALGEHWSAGVRGRVRSSTFDNIELELYASPAVEWNFFPYSMYTRRQLRVLYGIGVDRFRYYEETLYEKTEETLARQDLSTTYEQREPWGTLEGRVEWSNFFPGLSTHRLSVDSEVNLRIARGFSVSIEASVSRIRDQLSLPKRDATPEEVLLRLRQLQSGFEARLEFGITYQFGSQFAAIVNPRFGQ